MNFDEATEFTKEFERLTKKYPSLPIDLKKFKKALPQVDIKNSKKNFTVLKETNCVMVVKARLRVACLKGVPKTRIVFILRIENDVVDFIEIYIKNDKAREDAARIDFYLHR